MGAVERHLRDGLPLRDHLSEFLDEFYTRPAERQAMLDPVAPLTGDRRQDAYVGAVAEHLAAWWSLRPPAWAGEPGRFLSEPWFVDDPGRRLALLRLVESPTAFRRRLIFTEAEPLRRARMPAG